MNPRRATAAFATAAGIVAAALAGCGTSPTVTATTPSSTVAAAPTTAAAPSAAAASDETAVRDTYNAYNQSLLKRDFATTCTILTEDAASKIIAAVEQNGGPAGANCEQAFESIYAVPEAASQLDEAAKSLTISDVRVSGDTATVTYGGSVGGQTVNGLTATMVRTSGSWRVQGSS